MGKANFSDDFKRDAVRQITEHLLRDQDASYGNIYKKRLKMMVIRDGSVAPRSLYQNANVDCVIGTIRCDLLDQVVVLNEQHFRTLLL